MNECTPSLTSSSASSKLTHESAGQFQRHIALKKTRHLPLKVTRIIRQNGSIASNTINIIKDPTP